MNKFFWSTKGAVLVIFVFVLFWYWLTQSVFLVVCSGIFTVLFYSVDFSRKAMSRNPKYIHFRIFSKKLSQSQKNIIGQHYSFYRRLKPDFQESFDHRVATFLSHYQFVSRQGLDLNEEKKVLIASCYTQLTFGMYAYLNDGFNKILVYPDYYYSNITRQNHLGEFNPMMKIIVFSWKNFFDGIKNDTNNFNLGIHEFSHAILSSSKKKRTNAQTVAESDFENGYFKIKSMLNNPDFYNTVYNSSYFRKYAFTNHEEFISVILEHFFETPQEFKTKLPELFEIVKKMINYREEWFQSNYL